jgi:hypothetical protein
MKQTASRLNNYHAMRLSEGQCFEVTGFRITGGMLLSRSERSRVVSGTVMPEIMTHSSPPKHHVRARALDWRRCSASLASTMFGSMYVIVELLEAALECVARSPRTT